MSNALIRTEGLTKRYGAVRAVDGIDLEVREGDVYGFLGANGSGKTTTVRMLLGLVLATSGEAELFGEPMPAAAKSVLPRVGALVEGPGAYPHLSGRGQPRALRRRGTVAAGPAARAGRGSTRCSSRSASTRATSGRSRPTRSACASGSGSPRR